MAAPLSPRLEVAAVVSGPWKKSIMKQLKERNRVECDYFRDILRLHNKVFESTDNLRSQNMELHIEAGKLRQENLDLQVKLETSGGPGSKVGEKTAALEQKLFKLQEELTEMHRRKGENIQQLIDLNNAVQEKEKELIIKDSKLNEAETTIEALRKEIKHLEQGITDLQEFNQALKDEQQALQLAYSATEHKLREVQSENQQLVQRWLEHKSKDADKLNLDNEKFVRRKQFKLQRELAEAAREQVFLPEKTRKRSENAAVCIAATIPNKALSIFDAHDGEVNAIKFGPIGRILATGGSDRKIKLWEVIHGKCELKGMLTGSNAGVTCLDFDTEESFIVGASNDFACRVWSVQDQRLRHTLTGHSGKVMAAKFLSSSSRIVTGSHDRTLKIWDLKSKACIRTIFAGSSCNDLVTCDAAATTIISGHFDKKIRFWDARSDNSTNEITLQGRLTSLELSQDRTLLLSCSREDNLKLIDLRTNQILRTFNEEHFKVCSDFARASLSPDCQYTAAGSSNGTIFVWNTDNELVERSLKEHRSGVLAVTWHPTGTMLASGDKNKKGIVWGDF